MTAPIDFSAPSTQGRIRLPDGKEYDVQPLNIGEELRLLELAGASDEQTLPAYSEIAVRVTQAPASVIHLLTGKALAQLLLMARVGVQPVAELVRAESAAAPTTAARKRPRK